MKTRATLTALTLGAALTVPLTAAPADASPCQPRILEASTKWAYSLGNVGIFTIRVERLADCRARMRTSIKPRPGDRLGCNLDRIRGWRLNPSSVRGYNQGVTYVVCKQIPRGWTSRWAYFTPHGPDGCFDLAITQDIRVVSDLHARTPTACGA